MPPGLAPQPFGVAPAASTDAGELLAAVGPGEAVWLGFQAVDRSRPAAVRVRVDGPEPLDALTGDAWEDGLAEAPRNHLVCPPDYCLAGVRGPDGYVPFREERLTLLSYEPAPAEARVHLVPPAVFTELTGIVPDPIDLESGYSGWLAP